MIDSKIIERIILSVKPEVFGNDPFYACVAMRYTGATKEEVDLIESLFSSVIKDKENIRVFISDFNGVKIPYDSEGRARLDAEDLANKTPKIASYVLLTQHGIAIDEKRAQISTIKIIE